MSRTTRANSPLAGEVSEYNAATGALVNASFVSGLGDPLGIAVSGNDLYVTDETKGTIGEYDATTAAAINASLVSALPIPMPSQSRAETF